MRLKSPPFFSKALLSLLATLALFTLWLPSLHAEESFMAMGNTVIIEANEQSVDLKTNISTFEGNVVVTSGETIIRAPRGNVRMNEAAEPSLARFEGGVTVTRGKDKLTAPTLVFDFQKEAFTASGGVDTTIHPQGKAPVKITSETQQYLKSRGQMLASGNVQVLSEDARATSNKALLVLGPGNSAERVTFIGNARMQQEDANVAANEIILLPQQNVFMAQGGAYTRIKSAETEKPIVLRSAYQQLDRNKGLLLASGSVDLDFETYNARGPKATFYLNNGQDMNLKKAVFSGRPTLREGNLRTVTADTIEVTTNPRHFDARGNVKTRLVQTEDKPDAKAPGSATVSGKMPAKNGGKPASKKPVITEEDEFNTQAFDLGPFPAEAKNDDETDQNG